MKKSLECLVLSSFFVGSVASNAYSHNIPGTEKLYGHVNAYVGYQLGINEISTIDGDDKYYEDTIHSLSIGGGYNLYYKLNNTVNPFIGATANVNIPLTSKFRKNDYVKTDVYVPFEFAGLFGVKTIVNKNISVESYFGYGRSIAVEREKSTYLGGKSHNTHNSELYIFGVKALIKERYTAGLEYRLTPNLTGNDNGNVARPHALNFNFGVQLF